MTPADPHERRMRTAAFRPNQSDEEWLDAFNDVLAAATLPGTADGQAAGRLPLIYIVGAPRSGTTLMSQLLSRSLRVGYINNLIARFWRRPSVGIRLSKLVLGDRRDEMAFESEFGSTRQPMGPHEFGYFWRHWLQLDRQPTHHLPEAELRYVDTCGLQSQLREEILASFGLPVVFKNVICGFHAEMLTTVHPASLFIHVVRDRRATAASILKSRQQRYGSYDAWWSLKPSTFDAIIHLTAPAAQVVRQVDDCRREIADELHRPGVYALTTTYEMLCRDPQGVVRQIVDALRRFAAEVSVVNDVPCAFRASVGPDLPPEHASALDAALGV